MSSMSHYGKHQYVRMAKRGLLVGGEAVKGPEQGQILDHLVSPALKRVRNHCSNSQGWDGNFTIH